MAVLTISRQLGSEGGKVALEAARSLGYALADKELLGHILGEYGLVEFEQEYDATRGFWDYFDDRVTVMVEMLNKAILAIAAMDNVVILGRGAFALLRGYEGVVNARIQAPFADRVRRVAEREKLENPTKAADIVKQSDRARASFVESVFKLKWDDAESFDIVVNSSIVAAETAASWLAEAIESVRLRPAAGGLRVSHIVVDAPLADAVRSAFASQVAVAAREADAL